MKTPLSSFDVPASRQNWNVPVFLAAAPTLKVLLTLALGLITLYFLLVYIILKLFYYCVQSDLSENHYQRTYYNRIKL